LVPFESKYTIREPPNSNQLYGKYLRYMKEQSSVASPLKEQFSISRPKKYPNEGLTESELFWIRPTLLVKYLMKMS
jgi:hypothetical protein